MVETKRKNSTKTFKQQRSVNNPGYTRDLLFIEANKLTCIPHCWCELTKGPCCTYTPCDALCCLAHSLLNMSPPLLFFLKIITKDFFLKNTPIYVLCQTRKLWRKTKVEKLVLTMLVKSRLSVTNLSSENNLPMFWLNAPVIIRVKVLYFGRLWQTHGCFIALT